MQLILSEIDLEKMPPELRQNLLDYLAGAKPATEGAEPQTARLGRPQVTALAREASFHRDGHALHALLKRLAYGADADAPPRQQLAEVLPRNARKDLTRHLSTLNRLTARATQQRGAKLWHYQRTSDSYTVHPTTRKMLRDLLPALARSGEAEEPLWEG